MNLLEGPIKWLKASLFLKQSIKENFENKR